MSPGYAHFLDKAHPEDYRRREIEALIQAIEARENRLLLGLPGSGKSNLLRFLVARRSLVNENVTFVYLNCETLGGEVTPDAFFTAVSRELQEQQLVDQLPPAEDGYQQLMRLATQIGGDLSRRLVIVADQADPLLAVADNAFYLQLEALTDLNKRICYIFAAHPPRAGKIDPQQIIFVRWLAVGALSTRDCSDAVVKEGERLKRPFTPKEQQRLARPDHAALFPGRDGKRVRFLLPLRPYGHRRARVAIRNFFH